MDRDAWRGVAYAIAFTIAITLIIGTILDITS